MEEAVKVHFKADLPLSWYTGCVIEYLRVYNNIMSTK